MTKLVLLTMLATGAYSPSSDPNIVAWYRFESGALTTDSTANGNDLTDNGSVGTETTLVKEGSACAKFTGSEYFSLPYASWSSNWPLKNSDLDDVTTCAWVRFTGLSETVIWGPHNECFGSYDLDLGAPTLADDSGRSWALLLGAESGSLPSPGDWNIWVTQANWLLNDAQSGNQSTRPNSPSGHVITTGVWYHIYQHWDYDDDVLYLSVYNDSTGNQYTLTATYSGYAAQTIHIGNATTVEFLVGAGDYADSGLAWATDKGALEYVTGYIDDLIIGNRPLTTEEITEIRNQTFDGPGGGTTPTNYRQVIRIGME